MSESINETAAVELATRLRAEIAALRTENARRREALEWYASEDAYRNKECDEENAKGGFFTYSLEETPIAGDRGNRARTALGGKGGGG